MLQLILGRSGFGKTHTIRKIIKEKLKKGQEKILLIVPEQYSFETEKAMLELVGEELYSKIFIMSFRKLSEYIFENLGKPCGTVLNDSHKAILMYLSIESVKDKLKIYKDSSNNDEFISMMLSANDEFKMCNINNDALEKISSSIVNRTLKAKLSDAQLILSRYDFLLKDKFIDPTDELTLAYNLLQKNDLFKDYSIFFDSFDGFTPQQLLFLEYFLKCSKETFITFCTDKETFFEDFDNTVDLFEPVDKNVRKILEISKKNNIKVNAPIILNENPIKNQELSALEENFLRTKKNNEKISICDSIEIYNAKNQYDEMEFVAKSIKKAIESGNYRYKDIFIISRNEQLYKRIIDICFQKYNIPLFFDKTESVEPKLLPTFFLSLLEIIKGNFQSSDIFKLLKIDLLGFDYDEISDLENYVLLWNIDRSAWFEDFKENPRGLCGKLTDEDIEKLKNLNALRVKIINPILIFSEKLKKSHNGKEITEHLYRFCEEINLREKIKTYSENLLKNGEYELAKEQVSVWNLMVNIFEDMAKLLTSQKISIEKYYQVLKIVLNLSDIGKIPSKIDCVAFGTADRIRPENKKIVFLIGANEGEFPRYPASAGIFSDDERCKLLSLGLNLYDSLEGLSLNERFLSYKAVTLPSEKLFVSFVSSTLSGETKYPSEIVKGIKSIFENVDIKDEKSFEIYDEIWTKKSAIELLSKHFKDNSRLSNTLKKYLKEDNEIKDKVNLLEKVALKKPIIFEDQQNTSLLFKDNVKLSASQVESYYLCPFQFFCKYSLKAKKRKKVEFNSLEYGSLMHFVLEKILKNYSADEIKRISKNDLEEIISNILNDYVKLKFGELKTKTDRFKYLFSRVAKAAVPLILHIADEFSQSEFKATDFELQIGKNSKVPALRLELGSGDFVEIEGKIDRVDTLQKNGQIYVRVVDYKTGTKEFNLSDILYGLNLQMLVYLLALEKNPKNKSIVVPCGVLYMPAIRPTVTAEHNVDAIDLNSQKTKKLKMNGLLIDSPEIIEAMEKDAKGIFIPAKIKNSQVQKSESLVSTELMGKILKKIESLIIEMAENLKSGLIPAKPAKGLYDACEFCDYKEACSFEENSDQVVNVENFKTEEVERFLDGISQRK